MNTPNTSSYTGTPPSLGNPVDKSMQAVVLCGLGTSALALLGVYLLDVGTKDCHIMGLYADYVIPAGALIVGVLASSGYGVASWMTGTKITRKLLWTILALQFMVYFAAQYVEFRTLHLFYIDGRPVGFFEYFDVAARSFAWNQRNGQPGQPLGAWGYFFRGLEVLGFVGGSLLVPAALWKVPYCQTCQRYMKTRELTTWAASVPVKKIKKTEVAAAEAHQAEQQQALEKGKETWAALKQAASASEAGEFRAKLLALQPDKKAAGKLPQRMTLKLIHCRQCLCGRLRLDMVSGQGKDTSSQQIEQVPVEPHFVHALTSTAAQSQS
jgi:hypothetical protein